MLQSMGSQRVRHDLATEQQQLHVQRYQTRLTNIDTHTHTHTHGRALFLHSKFELYEKFWKATRGLKSLGSNRNIWNIFKWRGGME